MRIVSTDAYGVYIYAGDHPPPHCHVRWHGENEVVVSLPNLQSLYGDGVPSQVREFLLENLDKLCEEWDRLNPKTHKRSDG